MRRRVKKRFFDKQVRALTEKIAKMFPRCAQPLDTEKWNWIRADVQRLINKAYSHGFGRGVRDGLDNPRA